MDRGFFYMAHILFYFRYLPSSFGHFVEVCARRFALSDNEWVIYVAKKIDNHVPVSVFFR